MILTLPVSHVDIRMAEKLAARIVKLGGMDRTDVVVVSTRRAQWEIEPIVATLKPGFKTTTLHVLPDEDETGWPESANHLFLGGARFLEELYEPFYWFEADNFPLYPQWWKQINQEYDLFDRPFMGVINVSRFFDENKNVVERGSHMVGTGIYPMLFLQCWSERIHHLDRMPWDVYLGPEVVPHCHNTGLIAHRWGTCNYRMENGVLVCDNTPHGWHPYAAPIPPGAAVIHGCKDFSLYNLADTL